jgi:signal transduction histidine kinase
MIFEQIVMACGAELSCYEPVFIALRNKTGLIDERDCITYNTIVSAMVRLHRMEEGNRIAKEGIRKIQEANLQNEWLIFLHCNAALTDGFLSNADSALYYADKAEQLVEALNATEYAYRPQYVRAIAYQGINMPTLALYHLQRANELVNPDDRMTRGFLLVETLDHAKKAGLTTAFQHYLKEYVRFVKSGNTPADAMHRQLEDLFTDDRERIKVLEQQIREIEAEGDSSSQKERATTRKLRLIDMYSTYGEYEKAITELKAFLADTALHPQEQVIGEVYEGLIRVYTQLHVPDSALKYSSMYVEHISRNYQNNLAARIAEYETKFRTQEKDKALAEQEKTIEKGRLNQRTLVGLLFLALLTGSFGWFFFRKQLSYQKAISAKDMELNANRIRELEHQNKLLALNAMIEGQESERLRIAQELHDGLGGLLSTVKVHFTAIQRELAPLHHLNVFERTNQLIDEACTEVRRIAHDMVPYSIHLSGLSGALEELKAAIEMRKISCELEIHGLAEASLDDQKEAMIYRIIQEITTNAVRHSGASHLHIQLILHEGKLHLMVEDNGKGFDINAIAATKGMGMKSIDSRVRYFGGTVQYDSTPNHGTIVNVEIPL